MATADVDEIHAKLLSEHERLVKKIDQWHRATIVYRWGNVWLFMICKTIVPIGALIVAVGMISEVLNKPLIDNTTSAIIAVIVTFFASLESILNPSAKKRLAFVLNNELSSIENRVNITKVSGSNEELQKALIWADDEIKRLLNHYAENGY